MKKINEYAIYLLDLDGTLVDFSFEDFTNHYYRLLIQRFQNLIEPSKFLQALNAGIIAMIKNDGAKTNEEAFFEEFSRVLGEDGRKYESIFQEFYETDFKKLRSLSKKVDGSKEFVKKAKELNKKIVVATNPVFPFKAIEERLRWAGFQTDDFDLITSFELMRACKPNVKYFLQIAEELGIDPSEAVMIGDDAELDLGALDAGMDVVIIGKGKLPEESFNDRVRQVKSFKELLNELP